MKAIGQGMDWSWKEWQKMQKKYKTKIINLLAWKEDHQARPRPIDNA